MVLLPSPQSSPTGRGGISAVLPAPVCARKRVSPDTKQVLMGAGGRLSFRTSAVYLRALPPPQPSPAADAGASCEGGGDWRQTLQRLPKPAPFCPLPRRAKPAAGLEQLARSARKGWGGGSVADDVTAVSPVHLHTHRALKGMYSHPPKASYGAASPRRTNAYRLRRRALSGTFGGWL